MEKMKKAGRPRLPEALKSKFVGMRLYPHEIPEVYGFINVMRIENRLSKLKRAGGKSADIINFPGGNQ